MLRKLATSVVVLGALATCLGLVGIAGAQGSAAEVTVTVKEFKVEMSSTTIPANTPVKFSVTNSGAIAHEIVLEKAGTVDEPLELACGGGDCKADESEIEDIAPGTSKSGVWTLEPGQYQLACHVPGHFEAGMLQTFTVNVVDTVASAPAPSSPAPAPQKLPATGGEPNGSAAWWVVGLGVLMIAGGLGWRYRLSRRR